MSVGTVTVHSIAVTYESHDGKVSKVLQTDASSFIVDSDSEGHLNDKAAELLGLHAHRISQGLEAVKSKDFPAHLWKDNK